MPFFKPKPKSARQKAQRTQMRVAARVACCAYIVFYVIIPMMKPPTAEETMDPNLRLGIAIAFIVTVAVIMVFTIREIIVYWKAGYFKAEAYTDDPDTQSAAGTEDPAAEPLKLADLGEDDPDDDSDDDDYGDDDPDDDDYYYDDDSEDEADAVIADETGGGEADGTGGGEAG